MLAANSGRVTNLTRVTYLVMDEADRMFDLGKCFLLSLRLVIQPEVYGLKTGVGVLTFLIFVLLLLKKFSLLLLLLLLSLLF